MRGLSMCTALTFAILLAPPRARAIPAPDSVAVLANADVPASVALAQQYAAARDIPDRQVCALSMPATEDITLDQFRAMIREPLEQCLADAGVLERIEAIVVMRGAPLRVSMDVGGIARRVSLAAALGLWETTLDDGTEVLGQDPGRMVDCGGTPCLAAAWPSAYSSEPFRAGWTATLARVVHRPMLVTMIHARTDADAAMLIEHSVASEGMGGAGAELLFMEGADAARGALDREYDAIIADLVGRGLDASRTPFATDLTGRTLAAFFTGTASLGTTIEGNTYVPGALVDNLTSFGAVPENFRETGESQVSIARWVAAGVTGAHGTTDEPLNNCFPSRRLILDYANGATLAEAYLGRMPYVYWHNLVLGDPIAAPYADRPTVTITGASEGIAIEDGTMIHVEASTDDGRAIAELAVYVDGQQIARGPSPSVDVCVTGETTPSDVHVLAVATTEDDLVRWPARGWTSVRAPLAPGDGVCLGPDGGTPVLYDGSVSPDGGTAPPSASGGSCGCTAARPSPTPTLLALASLLMLLRSRRHRGR